MKYKFLTTCTSVVMLACCLALISQPDLSIFRKTMFSVFSMISILDLFFVISQLELPIVWYNHPQ